MNEPETLQYSDYVIREMVPSRIDLGRMLDTETAMLCPHCKQNHRLMEHGETRKCSCGLTMVLHGNGLRCSL